MFKRVLSDEENQYLTKRALDLYNQGGFSEQQIAAIISEELGVEITRNQVHGRIYRAKKTSGLEELPRYETPYMDKYYDYIVGNIPPVEKTDFDLTDGLRRIFVLNDIHLPFQHEEALEWALSRNRSAHILVTSDLYDAYSLTPFTKDKNIPLEFEIEEILRLLEFFNDTYSYVLVINSCHGRRVKRYFGSHVDPSLFFLTEMKMLKVLARPFENVVVVDKPFAMIGDAIFAHAPKFSASIPMRGGDKLAAWITMWKELIPEVSDFKVIVQGHTHHQGLINYHGLQIIESGCMQRIPSWIYDKMPMQPWVLGYAVLTQYNGVTDRNKTQLFVYDE